MSPKQKFSQMSNEELEELRDTHLLKTENAARIIGMNPIPMPIQDWIALRDANQALLHDIALINEELRKRAKS